MNVPKIGFELRKIRLGLADILPMRQIKSPGKRVHRYETILVSLREVGLVEPLVVYPQKKMPGKYLLLDGHLRYFALQELNQTSVECIIANDDECFTYNARVNRLPPIQEHEMIMKAIRNGVSAERIAAALNMPVRIVLASMRLLDGIHKEAADLLKDKNVPAKTIRLLKRVNGIRQIEIAELMASTNNFFTGYAEALVLATHSDQLVNATVPKKKEGMLPEDIAKMEQEMEILERDLKDVSDSYTENMFNLTCARGYIKKLLENAKVVRFLNANYPEIFGEFESISLADTV
jgi:ParB-like chromosome segregation protein Spo0J